MGEGISPLRGIFLAFLIFMIPYVSIKCPELKALKHAAFFCFLAAHRYTALSAQCAGK